MVRTRVGYAGGEKKDPTYHDLGGNAETIEIDYDPSRITYQDLLDVFWESHDPTAAAWSTQYRSVIFFHGAEQKKLAEESKAKLQKKLGKPVTTEIVAAGRFTRAEDYHQKYRLRQAKALWKELVRLYGSDKAAVDSTAAARLNAYLDGDLSRDPLEEFLKSLDLPEGEAAKLLKLAKESA